MNILITGRQGQLAQALQLALAGEHRLTLLGRGALDLTQSGQIRSEIRRRRPDLIINAAAFTAVDRAEQERDLAFAVNAYAPGVIAEEAAALNIPLVHYSTDYVFDGRKDAPYTEQDAPGPVSAYGLSKRAGELAIQAAGGAHLILRTSWVFSARGNNFLLTMGRLLRERDELRVVDDQIGAPTSAAQLAEATAMLVRQWARGTAGPSGIYHLTAQGQTSWYGFACLIADHLQGHGQVTARLEPITSAHYQTLARRPANSRLDCGRIRQDWGIELADWQTAAITCLDTLHAARRAARLRSA